MSRATDMLTIAAVNGMDRDTFVRTLGSVFERSPWVAERTWRARPFASRSTLHDAMTRVVTTSPLDEQVALLRAHPDLAGKAARAGGMSAASVSEQSSAGLDRLTDEEFERFARMNHAYREKFGFPFIIAVRRHDKASILAAFARRLEHAREEEISEALTQIFDITRMRLERLIEAT
jgi:2-oxo-4-hydroxy-4-carboxy-5-ureidoimidazoline decarboxylase